MNVFGKSDIGLKRNSNQDSFDAEIVNNDMAWAVVCDGMGGANGGDIASNTAVESVKECMLKDYTKEISEDLIKNLLLSTVQKANSCVYNKAQNDSSLLGMGTTLVLAAVFNDKLYVVHVGDSRAYLINNGYIKQLTVDHSVVQNMIDNGEITQDEAKFHPNKNVITRALGLDEFVEADYSVEQFNVGDVLVVCTDGLTNYLDAEGILNCLKKKKGVEAIDELIGKAIKCGGNDNITVVTIER